MKSILKHISLLLCSGLILPVCTFCMQKQLAMPVKKPVQVIKSQLGDYKAEGFSIYHEIAALLLPALKS